MGYKRCLEDLWNLLHKMTCGVDEIHCKVDIGKSMYNLNPWIKMFFKYPSSIAYTSPGWINSLGYRELVKWIIWCTKYMKLYSRKVNNRGDLKSKWKLRYALAKIWSKWFMWTHGNIILNLIYFSHLYHTLYLQNQSLLSHFHHPIDQQNMREFQHNFLQLVLPHGEALQIGYLSQWKFIWFWY